MWLAAGRCLKACDIRPDDNAGHTFSSLIATIHVNPIDGGVVWGQRGAAGGGCKSDITSFAFELFEFMYLRNGDDGHTFCLVNSHFSCQSDEY